MIIIVRPTTTNERRGKWEWNTGYEKFISVWLWKWFDKGLLLSEHYRVAMVCDIGYSDRLELPFSRNWTTIFLGIPSGILQEIYANTIKGIPHWIPQKTLWRILQKIPREIPQWIPQGISQEITQGILQGISKGNSQEIPWFLQVFC